MRNVAHTARLKILALLRFANVNPQTLRRIRSSISGKRPVRRTLGAVANPQIRFCPGDPMVDGEQSLLRCKIMDLHAAITVGRRSCFIAEVVNVAGSSHHFGPVDHTVIVRPELDVASRNARPRRNAAEITEDIHRLHGLLKANPGSNSRNTDLMNIVGECIHRNEDLFLFAARSRQFNKISNPIERPDHVTTIDVIANIVAQMI